MSDCRFGVSPVNYPDPDPDVNGVDPNAASDPDLRCLHLYDARHESVKTFILLIILEEFLWFHFHELVSKLSD